MATPSAMAKSPISSRLTRVDELPDYQAAAFLMAVFVRGMTSAETAALTTAMAASGEQLDWSDLLPYAVDKQFLRGVLGDTTTLVVLPLVAACGVPVVKMSGRGLGHSGGTLDKIEAIAGFRHQLSVAEMRAQVEKVGLALAGQSADLAPADGKFYALRDVTATVNSIPLIAASIMSKKAGRRRPGHRAGCQGGQRRLHRRICRGASARPGNGGRRARGRARYGRPDRRHEPATRPRRRQRPGSGRSLPHPVPQSAHPPARTLPHRRQHAMLQLARAGTSRPPDARRQSPQKKRAPSWEARLADGSAFEKLQQLVAAQGGDPRQLEDMHRLPQARLREDFPAPASGYLNAIDAPVLGRACTALGAGRLRKEDAIDPPSAW